VLDLSVPHSLFASREGRGKRNGLVGGEDGESGEGISAVSLRYKNLL
jgi:hypothetical protein